MSTQNDLINYQNVIKEANSLINEQIKLWGGVVSSIQKVGKVTPSSFVNAQKQVNETLQKSIELETKLEAVEKKRQATVQQGLNTGSSLYRQREKELALVERKAQAEEKASAREEKANDQRRLSDLQLQKQREQAFDKFERNLAKEQALLERSENVYNKVQQKVNSLTATYNNLATRKELGRKLNDHELAQLNSLEGRLNRYNEVLKKVDAQIGNNRRNVGNYASGFNGLGNSINQITRELPAFTFSAQTGFLALSNNIPILADEIQRVSANVKELRAQGQQVPSVMSQILTSFLSWQTALSIGVTLITVYGKEIGEFISEIFNGAKKVDVATVSLKAYNEALKGGEYKKAYTDVLKIGVAFDQAAKGTLSEDEALNTFNDTLGKVMGTTNSYEKAKQIYIDKKDDYIAATLAMASANTLFAQSAELNAKMMTLNTQEIGFWEKAWAKASNVLGGGAYSSMDATTLAMRNRTVESAKLSDELEANRKAISAFFDTYEQRSKNLNLDDFFGGSDGSEGSEQAKSLDLIKQRITAEYELRRVILERQKEEAEFSEDMEIYFEKSVDLANLEYENKKTILKLTEKDRITLNLKLLALEEEKLKNVEEIGREELDYIQNQNDKKLKSDEDAVKKRIEFYKNLRDAIREAREGQGNISQTKIQIQIESLGGNKGSKYWDLQTELLEDYYKTERDLAEGNALKLAEIDAKYTLDSIKLQNDRKNAFKESMTAMYSSALGEMGAGSLAQFFNGQFEEIWAGADSLQEKMAAVMMAIGQIANDVFNAMSERQNAYFEQQFKNLETEKNLAIGFAGENTAGKEAIEQQYDEKKRALQNEQAKREKRMAIAQANINIASAILGALATQPVWVGIAMAALVGVLGAVQLATIASTPLPQFYTGTSNAPEGLALTQERGAEMITDKHGNIKTLGNNKGSQLTYLNKGDKVFTADETTQKLNELLISGGVSPIVNVSGGSGLTEEQMRNIMQDTLAKQPKNSITFDENGIKAFTSKENRRTILKNRNVRI